MKEECIGFGFGFGFDLRTKGILDDADDDEEEEAKIFHFARLRQNRATI